MTETLNFKQFMVSLKSVGYNLWQ